MKFTKDINLLYWIKSAVKNRKSAFFNIYPSSENNNQFDPLIISDEEVKNRQRLFKKTNAEKRELSRLKNRWKAEQAAKPINQRSMLYKG